MQLIINGYNGLKQALIEHHAGRVLLVHGRSATQLELFRRLTEDAAFTVIPFTDFRPNPDCSSVYAGIRLLQEENCDTVIALGGGSAMDVAKCIRLYAHAENPDAALDGLACPGDVSLIAIPTTAGTGSEATRFAVIYRNGVKQSVAHEKCLPDAAVLEPSLLQSLPLYQRKATMLDALCHAVESCWSVRSTRESREIALQAIRDILSFKDGYLTNTDEGNTGMLYAANLAGQAINITQTTAGHAMCYKLTGLYGISHGHAAALCVSVLWPWMNSHTGLCTDPRGKQHLKTVFAQLNEAFGCDDGAAAFNHLLKELSMEVPHASESDLDILSDTVNPERLKNNPVRLDGNTITELYASLLR